MEERTNLSLKHTVGCAINDVTPESYLSCWMCRMIVNLFTKQNGASALLPFWQLLPDCLFHGVLVSSLHTGSQMRCYARLTK